MLLNITEHEAGILKSSIMTELDRLDREKDIVYLDMDKLDRDDTFYSDNLLELQCRWELIEQQIYSLSKLYNKIGESVLNGIE